MGLMPSIEQIHRALDVNEANVALGNEVFEAAGATFVRNREAPRIYDANHVANIQVASLAEIDALFSRVEQEFAGFGHRRFHVDHRTHPAVVGRLIQEGYERDEGLVMLLEGDLIGASKEFDIRPVLSGKAWEQFAELKLEDWLEGREKQGRSPEPDVGNAMVRVDRGKCPPVQYFLAYVGQAPAGYFNAWEGIDGMGQVDTLFTRQKFRHRGIATALIHHCVAAARNRGAQDVLIIADAGDTPKQLYAALGFEPVAVSTRYWRQVEAR